MGAAIRLATSEPTPELALELARSSRISPGLAFAEQVIEPELLLERLAARGLAVGRVVLTDRKASPEACELRFLS